MTGSQIPSVHAKRCTVCGYGEGLSQAPVMAVEGEDAFGRPLKAPTATLCEACRGRLGKGLLEFRWSPQDDFSYRAMVNGTAKRGYGCGRMEWREGKGKWRRVMSWN